MTNLIERIKSRLTTSQGPAPGMYHYQAPADDPRNYRLHLRIDPDGNGLLLVNAATVLHLNSTATAYAYYLVENLPAQQAGKLMSRRYHVPESQAREDYQVFSQKIQTLINTPDLDPVTFLDMERRAPFSQSISAPYRLDCALTYRLPVDSTQAAPTERVKQELSGAEWKSILDKAWDASIPHIVFTGGEATLREDLAELIAHAEHNDQVSGLLTDGLRLARPEYLEQLLQAGLDHAMILLDERNPDSWQAIEAALVEDLSLAVHLTLNADNQAGAGEILKRLSAMGVQKVSLSATDSALNQSLDAARNQAAFAGLELVWNLPVPYSRYNPVALETASHEQREAAGRAWMYLEPDGDVLAEQGRPQVLGNFLKDPWEKIWKAG